MKRIDVRDLYQMAGEALITKEQKSKLSAEDIASFSDGKLKAYDLILNPFRIDWGNGEQYPLDTMLFFESERPETACKMHTNKFETNQYRPKQSYEWRIRLFVKSGELKAAATAAFEKYLSKIGGVLNGEKEEVEI